LILKISQFKSSESNSKVKSTITITYIIELNQNDEIGCSVGLEDENNFFKWNVVFEGPTDTLYEV
jgi:ubiquitin-protein ligase